MILNLHPKNPEIRALKAISENLKNGAVYIFPTDTVYAIIADSKSKKGIEKLHDLKHSDKHKPLSILCPDISTVSEYVEFLPNDAFKLMKRITPGPFTFILKANRNIPRWTVANTKVKTIGIRIPESIFIQELLKVHDGTLTCTSVFSGDAYLTDINDLEDLFGNQVEAIIDGGIAKVEMSTILDFTTDEMEVLREGKGFDRI
ncbi:MAG TPA: L-threonylcarbamoyladenylate synthase [Leptospiraceae bacterium]|nr:L-threonylcarbamoyladenylate synthase [Leptospiraceae bacterium]HRG73304.1 L-threonylcarbamoyladenylate synthase [Leptospiraceae bacterium]